MGEKVQAICEGQIWRERDARLVRFVRVDASPEKHQDQIQIVTVIQCSDGEWMRKPGSRITYASRARFGKSGGYELVNEASG